MFDNFRFPKFTMMWRMTVGYLFAAVAFVLCGLIEAYVLERCVIDSTLPQTDPYFQKCALQSIDNTIWIIPYFFVTCAEVLVSISGLNFMYQEVGARTKSSASALWLVTVSIGSLIARTMYLRLNPGIEVTAENVVTYVWFYYYCAAVLVLASFCQMIIARWYTPKKDREDSKLA
jgi:dipeptide/tripeptide permease